MTTDRDDPDHGRVDHGRLARLLGHADLTWLVDRVRRRLERGETLDATVALTAPTPAQRSAVHRLLGRRPRPGATLTVALSTVDEVVRRSGACPGGLAAAVVALTGDVTVRAVAAADLDSRWRAGFGPLAQLVAERPELQEWYTRLHATGLVRRLTGTPEAATPLLAHLTLVLRHLPATGEPLGRFASRYAGGAHALDDDRPLTTLTLGAARALTGLPEGAGAEWRRELWAAVGLLRDDLSATVLTLGLPGDPTTATGRALAAWREAGQPVVLTLRQLVRDPPRLTGHLGPGSDSVSVCENPVVVSAAADHLGPACPPLICVGGQPGAAAMHLLRQLATAGANLRYHGDFDWGGVRIANHIFARLPARPWHFDTSAYRTAADSHADRHPPLSGVPALPSWDPDLGPLMAEIGLAVEEESVLDDLLTDLARHRH